MSEPQTKRASHAIGEPSTHSLPPNGAESRRAVRARVGIGTRRKHAESIPFNGLLTNKVLASLPGLEFEELLGYLEPVALVAGHEVYTLQQKMDYVYFPETAVISHLYFLEDGSTSAALIVGNEGMVGLSAILGLTAPSYWTHVIVGGSALRVRAEVIKEEFARGRALQQLMLSHIGARLEQLAQKAVCNGRHRVQERLCTWLLMIQDRVGEEELPLTHDQIAHHLGARRPGITAACNSLRDNGMISYHRGLIRILDPATLEASACECYQALKRPQKQNTIRRGTTGFSIR